MYTLAAAAAAAGGYDKFKDELRVDQSYLPTWLQSLGYATYYTGRLSLATLQQLEQ
jgi:hypothetical protein